MLQADLSTAMSQANGSGASDGLDVGQTEADIVRRAMGKLDLASRRGMSAGPGSDTRHPETNANPRSPVTDYGQVSVDLSWIVDVPRLPARRMPATTLHALQEWEGHVVEIGDGEFTARLTDVTAGASYEEEEAVIPLAEIADGDAARMREGSIFRWVIGYERSAAGTKKRVSQIVFRDLPAITEADLRDGEAWAREMMRSFGL